ncbi:MAG: hypothetical protein ACYTGX_16070 [Planctomycetota bacterium]|jgi:hypothetical protein
MRPTRPTPDEMPEQGAMIDGEFVPAQMLSAESVAKRVEHQLAELDAAADDGARRACLGALLHTVKVYGRPAVETLAGRGRTPQDLQADLEALPPPAP